MTGYLRGEVRLPGYLFLSARLKISTMQLHWILIFISFMFFTHTVHHEITAPVDGDKYSRHGRDFKEMERITRHGTTTLQHTTKRILGASAGCESRLLKNTKERSSPSFCWQVVNKLAKPTQLCVIEMAEFHATYHHFCN